jgi:putative hydrolase
MTNEAMSKRLREYALDLEREGANLFRARAFRSAAGQLLMMTRPLREVFEEEGRAGLERLPGIGKSLAYTIEGLLQTGELRTLRPIDAGREPDRHLTSLPGIGPRTAELLRDRLGITTLEGLRVAAAQGRLTEVGIGSVRLAELMAEVDRRLDARKNPSPQPSPRSGEGEPSVADLLVLDEEYRRCAEQHELPTVAPRSFNSDGESWLGVLRSERGGWRMRALFSNTALAHRLGRTHDWVVVYFERGATSGQRTVVTETHGDLAGQRVVRGREHECRVHYGRELQTVGSEPAA